MIEVNNAQTSDDYISTHMESQHSTFCSDDLAHRIGLQVDNANLQHGDQVTLSVTSIHGHLRHSAVWTPDPQQDNTHIESVVSLSNDAFESIYAEYATHLDDVERRKAILNLDIRHTVKHTHQTQLDVQQQQLTEISQE